MHFVLFYAVNSCARKISTHNQVSFSFYVALERVFRTISAPERLASTAVVVSKSASRQATNVGVRVPSTMVSGFRQSHGSTNDLTTFQSQVHAVSDRVRSQRAATFRIIHTNASKFKSKSSRAYLRIDDLCVATQFDSFSFKIIFDFFLCICNLIREALTII